MNRLARETSPYLREHAENPVDWYPWGQEAWNKARVEDKPIFLSIGYSACHWCHVMARESFENREIAAILNENFVSIKVDREELPEVDEIYMEAVRILNGTGGWPLSVFLTPELEPFYGGTYFPPEPRHGLPEFKRVLLSVLHYFRAERSEIEKAAGSIRDKLEELSDLPVHEAGLTREPLDRYYRQRLEVFDADHGGFGVAPKFPNPTDLSLLLRLGGLPGFDQARSMAELTLRRMAEGGICDQVGGGFHRYSTDTIWLVPHFEKMLYDNALLARVYAEATVVTGSDFYRAVALDIFDYLERELPAPGGGYRASQDADAPGRAGVEGGNYVWRKDEVEELLGPELAPLAVDFYGLTDEGNFAGHSVLRVAAPVEQLLRRHGLGPDELWQKLADIRAKLLAARTPARRDGKLLADWNGLALSALAAGSRLLDEPRLLERARRLATWFRQRMVRGRDLLHLDREGQDGIPGRLADYALVAEGFLDLWESGFDHADLGLARGLTDRMLELFCDPAGGFFTAAADAPGVIARTRAGYDAPIPSPNSVAVSNLLRLARLTGDNEYERIAVSALRRFFRTMSDFPAAFARMLAALDVLTSPATEVVLFLPDPDDQTAFRAVLRNNPDPGRTVVTVPAVEAPAELAALCPLVRERKALDGRPTAFVCRGSTCLEPVFSPEDLERILSPGQS